jgi:hypothetical protein
MTGIHSFVRECNRDGRALITPAHILLAAVGRAVRQHEVFRRRVVGRRVFRFKKINLAMPLARVRHGQIDLLVLENADERSISEMAAEIWKHTCAIRFRSSSPHPPDTHHKWSQLGRRVGLWFVSRFASLSLRLVSSWNWPACAWSREQIDVVELLRPKEKFIRDDPQFFKMHRLERLLAPHLPDVVFAREEDRFGTAVRPDAAVSLVLE